MRSWIKSLVQEKEDIKKYTILKGCVNTYLATTQEQILSQIEDMEELSAQLESLKEKNRLLYKKVQQWGSDVSGLDM